MNSPERMHQSIESKGREFVARQKFEMYSDRSIHTIIALKDTGILNLPRLVSEETGDLPRRRLEEDLRYGPVNGEIYTTRWQDVSTVQDLDTNRRSIISPEDYTSLVGESTTPKDLENLPKSGEVKRLVLSQVWKGLEDAIDQQDHILEAYHPASLTAEPQRMRHIIHWVDQTSRKLKEGPVTKDKLEEFSSEAALYINETGLPFAVNETKKKLATMLLKSAQPDSFGRVNPMISRIRLRSALLAATQRLTVSEMVRRKFTANLGVLVAEREFTRYDLEQASTALERVQQQLNTEEIPESERIQLASEVKEIATEYLRFPRVAPYLIPARLSAVFLVGSRKEKRDMNRQILSEETAKAIYSMPPAKTLIEEGELYYAGRSIHWAKSILDEVLYDQENMRDYDSLKTA